MSVKVTGDVRDKGGKVVGKLNYDQPESVQEAVHMFSESKVLAGFNYWLGVSKRKEASKLPSLDKGLLQQLRKNPELLKQLKEKLGG